MIRGPLTILFIASSFGKASALRSGKWCFEACELDLNYAEFNDTDLAVGSHKTRACRSRLRSTSLYLCIDEYCENEGRDGWWNEASGVCERLANVTLPPWDIINEYPPQERDAIKRLVAEEALAFPNLGEIVIPNEELFERAFTTLDAAFYEYGIHKVYGWCMVVFWATVITIGLATHLVTLVPSTRKQEWQPIPTTPSSGSFPVSPRSPNTQRKGRLYALLKRHLFIPATFNGRCSQPLGWCTIPQRLQTLTIAAFVLLNIILCSVDYRITSGNLYWSQPYIQRWRYVSDRTGILSLANFPLIWVFGMRNQVLIWVTGWGYGTYSNFHRWVARVSTVQAVVHSVGYTIMIWENGGWKVFQEYLSANYFWNGELATIFMCAILAFSVYGLRRSHYEIFLALHIIFSILVLLTMYYHVAIFPTGEYDIFIYPCIIVWLLDRILRAYRIFGFNPAFWNTRATVSYDATSNLVRMEVALKRHLWNVTLPSTPKPGMYYYVYVLDNALYAHQNHPFTVAYVTSEGGNGGADTRDSLLLRPRRGSSTSSTESDALFSYVSDQGNTPCSLVFLIRPYSGFTSRLAKSASSHQMPTHPRVLIEGPYGHPTPLHTYANILFVVGGTGIAVVLSHLSSFLSSESNVVSSRIVWAVREHAFVSYVLREFGNMLGNERVVFEVHITQKRGMEDYAEEFENDDMKSVRIEGGRPIVRDVIEDAAREVGQDCLAIMACGPAQMADQARQASVEMLAKGYRGIEYFEESFKW